MKTSELQLEKKRHHQQDTRHDAKPAETVADSARNRAAVIRGRLVDHETGRDTWEHSFTASRTSQREMP